MAKTTDLVVVMFHFFCFSCDLAFLVYLFTFPDSSFGWYYKYLTIWGETIQMIFFGLCLVNDFINLRKNAPLYIFVMPEDKSGFEWNYSIHPLQDHLDRLFTMCFPLANFIGVAFWSLIFPAFLNPDSGFDMSILPGGIYLAIQQHGFTWVVIWIEALLVRHVYGRKRFELPMFVGFCVIYLCWNIICWKVNGIWVYPMLQDPIAREPGIAVGVYLAMFIVAGLGYLGGRVLMFYYWRWRVNRFILHEGHEHTSSVVNDNQPLLPK